MNLRNFKKGTGLIELLVYTAILAMVSIFVINSILMMIKSYNGFRLSWHINLSAGMAMERMVREIRLGNDVLGASVFDIHPGHLVLDSIEFFASSSQLMLKQSGQDAIALTPVGIELTNLVFREVATSTNLNSKAIKIELEIEGTRANYQKSTKFYSTVVLRGSY